MRPAIRFLFSVILPGLLGCVSMPVATATTNPVKALTADGRLLGTLTITEQQAGFAGITGVIWTIDADGKYRGARFVNEKIEPPYKQGQLAPEALRALGKVMEAELSPLPARLGREAEINPRASVIRFAQRTWTLALPTGQSIDEAWHEHSKNETDSQYRFLRVVRVVLDSIGE